MPDKKYILVECTCGRTFATRRAPSHRAKFCSRQCERAVRTAALQQHRRMLEAGYMLDNPVPAGSSWLAVTSGKHRFVFTLIDTDLKPVASGILWGLSTRGYVFVRRQKRNRYLHHLAFGDHATDVEVDHINRNQLDNRRENLRAATHAQNAVNVPMSSSNTSGFRGVKPGNGGWIAQINANGARLHLGTFGSKEEAARARDRAARELHGVFAQLNFPDGEPS